MCGGGCNIGKIVKTLLPVVISVLASPLGTAIGGALGAGADFAPAIGDAVIGGGEGLLTGGGVKGALTGAATSGLAGGANTLLSNSGIFGSGATDITDGGSGGSSGGGGLFGLLSGGGSSDASNGIDPNSLFAGGSGTLSVDNSGANLGGGAPDLSGIGSTANTAANVPLAAGGPISLGGGGASSFSGGAGGAGAGVGSSVSGAGLTNLLSGGLNLGAENTAENQLVQSQQQSLKALKPLLGNATGASNTLATDLGTNGNTSAAGFGSLTAPFTPGQLQSDPGYQFDLSQGTNALNNANAASGNLDSGAALKQAQQFGQGLADTTYNNAFNRNLAQNAQTGSLLEGAAQPGAALAGDVSNVNSNIGTAQSKGTTDQANTLTSTLASLLSGSGAKPIIGYDANGHAIYGS